MRAVISVIGFDALLSYDVAENKAIAKRKTIISIEVLLILSEFLLQTSSKKFKNLV